MRYLIIIVFSLFLNLNHIWGNRVIEGGLTIGVVSKKESSDLSAAKMSKLAMLLEIDPIADLGPLCPFTYTNPIPLGTNLIDENIVFSWTGGDDIGLADGSASGSNPLIPSFFGMTGSSTITVSASLNGDTSSTTFMIVIEDNVPPLFLNCPEGTVFRVGLFPDVCESGAIWGIPIALDNCGEVFTNETTFELPSGTNPIDGNVFGQNLQAGLYTINYTAFDINGNESTCEFFIDVIDTEGPKLVCPPDITVSTNIDCSWTSPMGSLSPLLTSSNCPSVVSYTITGATSGSGLDDVSGQQFSLGINTVTYLIEEVASVQSTFCSFSVTVVDTEAPNIACPDDLTLNCGKPENENLISNWLNSLVVSDNCSETPTVEAVLVKTYSRCGGSESRQYKFTASDSLGNKSECLAYVYIIDTIAPQITVQASNFTAQCNGAGNVIDLLTWLNNNGGAQAFDECGGHLSWSNNYGQFSNDCGSTGELAVTFYVRDQCGNADSSLATFTIIDSIAPFWEKEPQALTIHCDGKLDPVDQITSWLNTVGGAEAKDSCSTVVYSNNYSNLADGCSKNTGATLVIFTAMDACGNTSTRSAVVTVADSEGPVIMSPAIDTVVACDGLGNSLALADWVAGNARSKATDGCSGIERWNNTLIETIKGCGGTLTYVYGFTATDSCGNVSVQTTGNFTIQDTTRPEISVLPQNIVEQCDGSGNVTQLTNWLSSHAGLLAVDNCSGIESLTYNLVRQTNLCALTGESLYRFTVTDSCGNISTAEASFTITDILPPIISGGSDMVMEECSSSSGDNYQKFDFWLSDNAGARATDQCSGVYWSNNYRPENWVKVCGNSKYVDVTFYAKDICGNTDSIVHRFSTGDVTPPVFINCPRPAIIVDATNGRCGSYVNFSLPAATDNCGPVYILQTDTSGLTSGSLFPVGLTNLEYTAFDSCGNQSVCEIVILVNDFNTPPALECINDTLVLNEPGNSSVVVNNITPKTAADNCDKNLFIYYEIFNSGGAKIGEGLNDASGFSFPIGVNRVKYTVKDQPELLITEIVQNGTTSGIEITNLGGSGLELKSLRIERTNSALDTGFTVPSGVVLAPGEVYVQYFPNISSGSTATYQIKFFNRIIDEITVNGTDFTGSYFMRVKSVDHNHNNDFIATVDNGSSSFGFFNSQLSYMPGNGSNISLQLEPPSVSVCSFYVTVRDVEAPTCAIFDTLYNKVTNIPINAGSMATASVVVPNSFIVSGVKIVKLSATIDTVGALSAYLENPDGLKVNLFANNCGNQSNIDIAFDDQSLNNLTFVSCNPMGNGLAFKPLDALNTFTGYQAQGTWVLTIDNNSNASGQIDEFEIEIYGVQPCSFSDTLLHNDVNRCDAALSWVHPVFNDNCCDGSMTVEYFFKNTVTRDSSYNQEILKNSTLNLGGTMATRVFKVGTTKVVYTLSDSYGNESTCEFNVSVSDTMKPRFVSGCIDRNVNLSPKMCSYNLAPRPTVTDNCAIDTIVYFKDGLPVDVSKLPIGSNSIKAVVYDIYGNLDSCKFTVTVNDYVPVSPQLICNAKNEMFLDASCTLVLTADKLLAGDDYRCLDSYCIEVKDQKGVTRPNVFTTADVGKCFTFIIRECSDITKTCSGNVCIQNRVRPQIECPRDTTIWCNIDPLSRFTSGINAGKLRTGELKILNCDPNITVSFIDDLVSSQECGNPRARIIRRWIARNRRGDVETCNQVINIAGFDSQVVTWPEDKISSKAYSCSDVARDQSILHPKTTGYPLIDGRLAFGDNYCDVSIGYTDRTLYDVNCPSAYLVFRTWEIFNRCKPYQAGTNPVQHVQVIRVSDNQAPVIPDLPDATVSMNAFSCTGQYKLPNFQVSDSCGSAELRWRLPYGYVENGIVSGLQKGSTQVTLVARDNCKNQTTKSFTITVIDKVAPVASAKQNLTVSLTQSDETKVPGFAKLFASQLDNGSYDNCSGVYLEVRRDNIAPACLNSGNLWDHDNNDGTAQIPWNSNITYNGLINGLNQSNPIHKDDNELDNMDNGQYVLFCCSDLDQVDGNGVRFGLHKVWLRVWDDAGGDGIYGNNGDNFNETWSMVRVEDRAIPKIECTRDITINCDRDITFTKYNFSNNWESVKGNVPAEYLPAVQALCGNYELEYRDAGSLNTCNAGVITRTYRVKGFSSVQCNQRLVISTQSAAPVLEHPVSLHIWNSCVLTEEDVYQNTVRLSPSVRQDIYGGCEQYNLNTPATNNLMTESERALNTTNGFTPIGGPLGNNLQNQARFNSNYKNTGCFVFGKKLTIEEFALGDGCKKWLVRWHYINWCNNTSAGCRETIYKYEDNTPPQIVSAPGAAADVNSESCKVDIVLRPTAYDSSFCNESSLKWVATIYPGIIKPGINAVPLRPNGETYNLTASGEGSNPILVFKELSAGNYGLRYKVVDGCGNFTERDTVIYIMPKAPTPYCINLGSAVMKDGLAELWASDFNKGSFTNCGQGPLFFTFHRKGKAEHPVADLLHREHFFKSFGELATLEEYKSGNAQKWIPDINVRQRAAPLLPDTIVVGGTSGRLFGCALGDLIGEPNPVETRVWDLRFFTPATVRGSSYCSTHLILIDNQGSCKDLISISGSIENESSEEMVAVDVLLDAPLPEYPIKTKTNNTGRYLFESLPRGADFEIAPGKYDDYLNGVNTLDIVVIQRHILGLRKLSSPYKLIAADIDGDKSVRINDLLLLRKLVLGITDRIVGLPSWRFVDQSDKLDNIPWAFKEIISHASLAESSDENNFVGIKIGDVDGNAGVNAVSKVTEPRSSEVKLTVEDKSVKPGDVVQVNFSADQFNSVYGMQFTLKHAGLELLSSEGMALDLSSDHIGKLGSDITTLSWSSPHPKTVAYGSVVFKLVFRATNYLNISESLQITSDVTPAEAYIYDQLNRTGINLEINNRSGHVFSIRQNDPNPWKTSTTIAYDLPHAGDVKLTITDLSGRIIMKSQLKGETGPNEVIIRSDQLHGIKGILIYQIESGSYIAQKKMLLIE